MKFPRIAVMTFGFALLASQAQAAENEYLPLLKARKFAEVERLAGAKLATDPANVDALVARINIINSTGDEKRLDEGRALAERCIAAHPNESACHNALGEVMGTKAMLGGIMSAISSAGKMREAFQRAIELDPKNYQARISLMQFYLMAPGIAGGGKGKAEALVAESAKISPDAGKMMQARMAAGDEKFAQAEALVLAVNPGDSDTLQRQQRDLVNSLANKAIDEKRFADAERLLAELLKRFPDTDLAALGGGRILHEQGKYAEAVARYEKAIAIDALRPQTYLRLGTAWQALKEKQKATAAFEKALGFSYGLSKKQRSEIQEQLKALKA